MNSNSSESTGCSPKTHTHAHPYFNRNLNKKYTCLCGTSCKDHGGVSNFMKRWLSTTVDPKPGSHADTDHHTAVIEWLTSSSSTRVPPPVNISVTISRKQKDTISVVSSTTTSSLLSVPLQSSHNLLAKLLKPLQQQQTSLRLLLLRSPSHVPPLHVEYSSPNIAKPLHMGHLRSTLTGKFVENVSRFAGHRCKSVCLLGDWGRQFGVLHAGVVKEANKQHSDFSDFIQSLNLHQLLQIYINSTKLCETDQEFNDAAMKYSAMLESGDNDCKQLWGHTKSITVEHLRSWYSKLDVEFDQYEGESEFQRDSPATVEALNMLNDFKLISNQPDGSVTLELGDQQHHILLKRDNSSVYLLRDVACALRRVKKHEPATKFLYVVDNAQSSHFQNLFETLKQLGVSTTTPIPDTPFASTHTHVGFGKVTGMSTRSGNFVLLSDVINTGTEIMHESRKKSKNARNTEDRALSEQLAIAGLVVNALKVKRNKSYSFDWGQALASKGNTGVSLQYTVARLTSLLSKFDEDLPPFEIHHHLDVIILSSCNDELVDLLVCLANFEDTFWKSYLSLEPCVLLAYAFNLNDKISKALASVKVVGNADERLQAACVWVYGVSKAVLCSCMRVVGVPVLDKGF